MFKKFSAILAAAALILSLAGCGTTETTADTAANSDNKTEQTEKNEQPEKTEQTESKEEESNFMQKCSDMITELAPDEIITEREGVEYPRFEKHYYYSNTAERDTPVNVLLPKDYSEDKEYPVLYILHGYWDTEDWMTRDNVHLSVMLNNLVADGEAEEMIVVCPYIFCSKELVSCTGMDETNTLAYDNFINDLTTDLMPFIEENFSVAKGRENTAITGFSMGAREALYIGFTYPDRFGYIGSACTAPGLVNGTGYPYNLERDRLTFTDNKPYLLMISASYKDGVVQSSPFTYDEIMTTNGVEHILHVMNNTGHDASSVTPHLYNYFRMIFKADK